MADTVVTPPVPQDVIDAINAEAAKLQMDVAKVEKWDKSPLVAALLHVAILEGSALYLKLPAKDIAVLGSVYAAGGSYFLTVINYLKVNSKK